MRRALRYGLLAFVVAGLGAFGGGYAWLRASLPALEGELPLPGLAAEVTVTRDSLGVPTVTAASRLDAARALGFVHAQERFFQMDLLRRAGAGELSALLGEATVGADRALRPHRFHERALAALGLAPERERAMMTAYAEGVNAGLAALGARPFEYLVLRQEPRPWRPEDTLLAAYAMFIDLQLDSGPGHELERQALDALPSALARFLQPPGDVYDAPLVGEPFAEEPVPPPESLGVFRPRPFPPGAPAPRPEGRGSNNMAVSGAQTRHGAALVANDMHLGLQLPNIWFRASLVYPAPGGEMRRVTGATLPGAPILIVGSNGRVAWGFTNSYGDYVDLVRLVEDEAAPGVVRTAGGRVPLDTVRHVIEVAGGEPETLEILESPWGPVLKTDAAGRRYAFQWTAHRPEAVNLGLLAMEDVGTVAEAIPVLNRAGIPAQNVALGDREGHVGWTIGGRLPRREGRDGTRPTLSTDPDARFRGFLDPAAYPRVVDPEDGLIWTANNRVVDGEWLRRIGQEPYTHAARARQIRDALRRLQAPVEPADLLALQRDRRALFYGRWQALLLDLLDAEALGEAEVRGSFREYVRDWGAAADTGSVGYRLVREFRSEVEPLALGPLLGPAEARLPGLDLRSEAALWALVSEWPSHLLNPRYDAWRDLLLDAVDRVIARYDGALAGRTWGEANVSQIAHPFADAVPAFGDRLRMPPYRLPGDARTPSAQRPSFGPSERMVVAPGHEAEGLFHMPGGQAGHPLSPYWGAGHDDWAFGRPSPFLPGPTVWTLRLTPE
ncbi:MAG: penicillin acylase family protein [Rubricoccaceae bacterium]|nr:penicillin acylase family protein [Rubricoccaceae bacterium]